jgi:predicted transglutaminase-like cysteine proteinase
LGRGVAAERLLIATVLDRRQNPHAVLVLRTDRGDYVLDNLANRMMHWSDTGYTFLRMQNPKAPGQWVAVFAGGVFADAGARLGA